MSNKKPYILIMDDDESILDVMKIVMENEGFVVETDNRGEYFQKMSGKTLPDLVLLDIMLRGKNGEEVCKKVKQTPQTNHIPVVIISAQTQKQVEKAAKDSGADDFITKPFDINQLVEVIKRNLK